MDIRLPSLGEGADSGTVANIFVKIGDTLKKDQSLIELESEKAVASVPSPVSGTVTKIHIKPGDLVKVGQLLFSVAAEEEVPSASESKVREAAPKPAKTVADKATEEIREGAVKEEGSPSKFAPPASPTVRKLARELGIDLSRVQGSEAGGRIVQEDLKSYILRLQEIAVSKSAGREVAGPVEPVKSVPKQVDFSKWGPVERKAVSSLRQTIAEKMTQSWTTIPHVTQFDEADITHLMELRKKYAPRYEEKGVRLTLTGLVLRVVVSALKKYPVFNSSLDEATHEIVTKNYYHLGVAVDTEQGLIVPVIKDADKKNLLILSKDLADLAERTRQRKVSLDELQGGTFTISNLGSIGGTFFSPIVNKPQVAILGLGRGVARPVLVEGKIENRLMLPLGLSYDHRVIDGADGARFIRELVEGLGNFKENELEIGG